MSLTPHVNFADAYAMQTAKQAVERLADRPLGPNPLLTPTVRAQVAAQGVALSAQEEHSRNLQFRTQARALLNEAMLVIMFDGAPSTQLFVLREKIKAFEQRWENFYRR